MCHLRLVKARQSDKGVMEVKAEEIKRIYRLKELPTVLEPNSIYLIKKDGSDAVHGEVTNDVGEVWLKMDGRLQGGREKDDT